MLNILQIPVSKRRETWSFLYAINFVLKILNEEVKQRLLQGIIILTLFGAKWSE